MKRFLSAGEGYALFPTNINYRWPRYFPVWRAPLLCIFVFFMCLHAGAMEPNPVHRDRAVPVASTSNLSTPQQTTLTGVVTDTAGRAIEGATIAIKGTRTQVMTDAEGQFSLQTTATSGTLVVSFMGYQSVEKRFETANTGPFRIVLQTSSSDLDEVVVIGYGQTSRRYNTGSVSTISAKEIEQQPVTNVLSALSGRMPGVFVQTTNGLPGGNINIQIRGKGSIAAGTQPLYIIDGVPFDGAGIGEGLIISSQSMTGPLSPLNNLNPQDIATITILKDADATAIYGSRGANGVVLITTKQGTGGLTKTSVNLQHGLNRSANLPRLMGLSDYLTMRREAFANSGRTPSEIPTSPDYAPDLMVWDTTRSTDWAKYLLGGTGRISMMNIGVRGGPVNTSFNVGANYHRESTVMPGDNHYQRGGLSFGLMHRSENGRLSIGLSNNLSLDDNKYSNLYAIMSSGIMLPPNYPLYLEDGQYNWSNVNPLPAMNAKTSTTTNNYGTGVSLSYGWREDLDFRLTGGYNRMTNDQINIFPTTALRPGEINNTNMGNHLSQSLIFEPQIYYRFENNYSQWNILIGSSFQTRFNERQDIMANNYVDDALLENLGSAANVINKSNNQTQYRYAAIFSRIAYNWLDRYIVNATVRRDGSSRFGPDDRFGTFGSLGFAWLFSEEQWIQRVVPLISFGKLKGSIGVTGNDQISDYGYLSTYASAPYTYLGVAGLQPIRISNDRFRWERTKKIDLSTELRFFDERISLNIGWYRNRSENQLVQHPLPAITGFISYQANMPATIENTGWEVEWFSDNLQHKRLKWETLFNISFERNFLKRFEGLESSTYANTLQIGYDITRITGYQFLGIDSKGKGQYADAQGNLSSSPYQYHTMGKSNPDFYGSLGNTFHYGNLSINLFFQFVKQEGFGGVATVPGSFANNSNRYYIQRWTQSKPDSQVLGAYLANDSFYRRSSANFFDTSYIRLKNLSLSYLIPVDKRSMATGKAIRFILQGQNLGTFWDRSSPTFDPESGTNILGGANNIPPMKTLMMGLEFNF